MPGDKTGWILRQLDEGQRDFLKAAAIEEASTTHPAAIARIAGQLEPDHRAHAEDIAKSLANLRPPLIRKHSSEEAYLFTHEGELAAQAILAEEEPDEEPATERVRLRARGTHNRAMEAYANQIGASVAKATDTICNTCRHHNSHGLKRGGRFLCQVCFAKGFRF